jgi:hypothetical protein
VNQTAINISATCAIEGSEDNCPDLIATPPASATELQRNNREALLALND